MKNIQNVHVGQIRNLIISLFYVESKTYENKKERRKSLIKLTRNHLRGNVDM